MSIHRQGTVFQTAPPSFVLIPRLRPGLLSLRSVLSSRQNDRQPNTKNQQPTTIQQYIFQHSLIYIKYNHQELHYITFFTTFALTTTEKCIKHTLFCT